MEGAGRIGVSAGREGRWTPLPVDRSPGGGVREDGKWVAELSGLCPEWPSPATPPRTSPSPVCTGQLQLPPPGPGQGLGSSSTGLGLGPSGHCWLRCNLPALPQQPIQGSRTLSQANPKLSCLTQLDSSLCPHQCNPVAPLLSQSNASFLPFSQSHTLLLLS